MKITLLIIQGLALLLAIFNATKINFKQPLKEDSLLAIITCLAALCVILLVQLLRLSKKVEQLEAKFKKKSN